MATCNQLDLRKSILPQKSQPILPQKSPGSPVSASFWVGDGKQLPPALPIYTVPLRVIIQILPLMWLLINNLPLM